jgi:hypothetical protein
MELVENGKPARSRQSPGLVSARGRTPTAIVSELSFRRVAFHLARLPERGQRVVGADTRADRVYSFPSFVESRRVSAGGGCRRGIRMAANLFPVPVRHRHEHRGQGGSEDRGRRRKPAGGARTIESALSRIAADAAGSSSSTRGCRLEFTGWNGASDRIVPYPGVRHPIQSCARYALPEKWISRGPLRRHFQYRTRIYFVEC